MEEGDPELKVVMVGPPGSGKSSMILSLTSDAYKNISEHTTTVFDKYCAKVEDSAGQSYQLRCVNPTQSCVQQCESLILQHLGHRIGRRHPKEHFSRSQCHHDLLPSEPKWR